MGEKNEQSALGTSLPGKDTGWGGLGLRHSQEEGVILLCALLSSVGHVRVHTGME